MAVARTEKQRQLQRCGAHARSEVAAEPMVKELQRQGSRLRPGAIRSRRHILPGVCAAPDPEPGT